MKHLVMLVVLTTLGYAQEGSPAPSTPVPGTAETVRTSTLLPDAPSLPKGKATVIGGTVSNLDRVRDQFTVHVFGSRQTMKILFDGRTQFFRDGAKISSLELRKEDHVSIETQLDGTAVFARSIHIFGQGTRGECNGQVLSYDAARGELLLHDPLSPEPVKLQVSSNTTVRAEGQEASSQLTDLKKGTLISAEFSPDPKGRRVAHQVVILAAPGTSFTFSGSVTYLDLHAGRLVLTDPRDKKTYEISFDRGRIPDSNRMREGADVIVNADFDGTRYVASGITVSDLPK